MSTLQHYAQSPANISAFAIAVLIVALLALAAIRSAPMRWLAVPLSAVIVAAAGGWIWWSTPRTTDVSDEPMYRELFHARLCLGDDAFITQWRDELPQANRAGFGSGVPVSIDDYLAHPNDWQHSDAYTKIYGSFFVNEPVPRVIAYARRGTPLRITRVVDHYRVEHHDHFREADGEINGHLADVSMMLIGNYAARPCGSQ